MSDESSHHLTARFDANSTSGLGFLDPAEGETRHEPTGVTGFNFEEVFRDLDGEQPDIAGEVKRLTADAVRRLIVHLAFDRRGVVRTATEIGRQLLATLYAVGLTNELTLAEIAAPESISKQSMSKRLREVKNRLGLSRHTQATPEAREAYRAAQVGSKHWRRRKAAAPTPAPA